MVYSSDFYTSRRPAYYKPASSYSVTPLYSSDGYDIPPTYYKAHQVYQTSTTPTPFILTPPISTAKPSPNVLPYNGYSYHHQYLPLHRRSAATIHGVLDRIEHRPRSHPSYDPTDEYLNSRSSTNFDDVTRDIRAQTAGLLKQVYTPTIRLKMSSVSNGYTELPIAQRIESDAYIEKILSDSDSYRREHNIGKGHLACVSYAGGKAYPRRRPHLSKEVDDNITMLSYYNKTREAAIASSTHPSVKINGTEKRVFNNIEPLERREYKSQLNNYSTQRTPTKTVTTENETSETVQLAAAKKSAEKETARLAAEEEAAKLAAEEEAARLAAEEEEARLAAEEEEARRAAEKEAARLAAEEEVAKLAAEEEAARLAAEEEEARRVAEEEEARRVAEEEEARLAAEEEAARLAAEEEAARLAAEEEEARLAAEEEEARLAAEEKEARLAAEEEEARLAAEEEEARKAAEEKAAKLAAEEEEARTAAEEETRLELEQKAQEDEITTETEKSEQNINSIEKIIYDEDTDSLGNKISSAIASTTTTSTEIINEEDGEIKTSAIFQRTIKKTTTITTSTSVTSENDDVNTSVEIQEIIDEDNEGSSEDEHDTEQDAAQAEGQESSEEEDESEEESKEE